MRGEIRARPLTETLALARAAGRRAGVTRVGDVTGFAVPGISVFQATRPVSCTLAVSQGKGLSPGAAIVSALLETVELWSAENIPANGDPRPLSALDGHHRRLWARRRADGLVSLAPDLPRRWLPVSDLISGQAWFAPRELFAFDPQPARSIFGGSEHGATSVGLATGNTRTEALASGVAELLEHHAIVTFCSLSMRERRGRQIALDTITEPTIRRLLARIAAAGFVVRAWSMLGEAGLAVIECTMFARSQPADAMLPVTGNGCHPDAHVAFLRALLEVVQTQATIVAGARDDLTTDAYERGREQLLEVLMGSFAFGEGRLDFGAVPDHPFGSSEACLEFLLGKAELLGGRPVMAYDHDHGLAGLHTAHVFAPGLLSDLRKSEHLGRASERQDTRQLSGGGTPGNIPAAPKPKPKPRPRPRPRRRDDRRLLFAGPSIHGLAIPSNIELRPPAVCGDFAALLDAPPLAVALIDGCFKTAPTVWHREILSLIATGTQVIGGASLGALRAAELDGFGMVGVGEIYQAYRAGALIRDDAVMLDHAPAELGHVPLTIALVDAEQALFRTDLPPRALRMMQRIVRTMPYERRDWRVCLAYYRQRMGEDFPVSLEALEAAPSLKRSDARLTIEALATCAPAIAATSGPVFQPAITDHYRQLLASRAPAYLASLT